MGTKEKEYYCNAISELKKQIAELENRTCKSCIGYVDFDYCKIIEDDCSLIATLCNGCNRYETKGE